MNDLTVSEKYFEKLCAAKSIKCVRIPESTSKSADYRVSFDSLTLIVEIKELAPNHEDEYLSKAWDAPESPAICVSGSSDELSDDDDMLQLPPMCAPVSRVRGLLNNGYSQIKQSSEGKWPAMIVVYNNAGVWNRIDTFTIARAMFGNYGIKYKLQSGQAINVTGQGYFGGQEVTETASRSLSAVGVLKRAVGTERLKFSCYHNPFASIPIKPDVLKQLADVQYLHPNPHRKGFIPWKPREIEI